jgi:eukaryotic-like serine/threonine-protein kinase
LNETSTLPIAPGQVIGERYRVGALLGEGGMGVVCEAVHVGLELPVAIKFIRTDLKDDSEFVQRFLNEARRAAALKSEHVARVHDVGQLDSGALYLVMERLEGIGLEAHIREQAPLPQADAVSLIREACEGLSEAHAAGIVHRDIKPENLFLARRPDGKRTLKILDFGISKQTTEDAPTSLTNSQRSLGSPWYMSPEQMIDTSSVDHRADIWSLGVVLFELLTGTRPFEGSSIPEVCAGVLTAPAPALRERRPDIDPALESIVARCLAKNPDERHANVLELSRDLEPFAAARGDAAAEVLDSGAEEAFFRSADETSDRETPISLVPTARAPSRRMTLARSLGMFGILVSVALAVGAFIRLRSETSDVAPALAPATPSVTLVPAEAPPPPPSAPPVVVLPMAPAAEPPAQPPPPSTSSNQLPTSPASPGTAEATKASPAAAAPGAARRPPAAAEPALTPEEIRRRKQRYERWLREQGLRRVDEVVVPRASDSPFD